MSKTYIRHTSYCTEKYQLVWKQKKVNVFESNIEIQKGMSLAWFNENSASYFALRIHFYEIDDETGECKLLETYIVDNTKPKPRVINDDSSSNPIEEETFK